MYAETDKIRLLEQIDTEYAFIERTLEKLTPEEMLEPNVSGYWTVKDTLAHLTRWLNRLHLWIESMQTGVRAQRPEEGWTWAQMDEMNDHYVHLDQNLPLEDVLRDFRMAHLAVVEQLEELNEEALGQPLPGARDALTKSIRACVDEHYYEHIVPVRAWMNSRASNNAHPFANNDSGRNIEQP